MHDLLEDLTQPSLVEMEARKMVLQAINAANTLWEQDPEAQPRPVYAALYEGASTAQMAEFQLCVQETMCELAPNVSYTLQSDTIGMSMLTLSPAVDACEQTAEKFFQHFMLSGKGTIPQSLLSHVKSLARVNGFTLQASQYGGHVLLPA